MTPLHSKDEELYEIKGDPNTGMSFEYNLGKSAVAHPQVRFGDRISESDLYAQGDELMVHFYCPRCENANSISSKKKRISWSGGERLSIAAFRCTWPGCGLALRIDDNIATEVSPDEISSGF
jgi:hypothetical protein